VWYVVLGAAIAILPPGPLSPPDQYVWLRGLATVASGLAVFWLAPIERRWLGLLGHLVVAGVQGVLAAQIINQPGALTSGLTLLVVAVATATLPLYNLRATGPVRGLPVYPMGAVAAAMGAVQGLATVTGSDRSALILMAANVSPQAYGTAMLIVGALAVAVCWTGYGGRRLVTALTWPSALFVLGISVSAGLFVSSSYWVLNASGYVRAIALFLSPLAGTMTIDWRSAFARTAITVTSTAIAPVMLIATLVLYGPGGLADSISESDRQLLFGLIVLLILGSVAGALFAARELTGPLFGLAQLLRKSSVETLALKPGSQVTEVEILRGAVVDLYDKLLAQNAELTRANSTKDEFLGLVSHELKTPITTILAASGLIRQRVGPGEAGLIDDLEAETDRLAAIVDNLLALARMDAGATNTTEPLMLNHLARQEVERAARKDPSREYRFATDGEAVVDAVDEQILMVLRNFIANAAKYSPVGSAIDVRVSTDGNDAVLAVRDTGAVLQQDEIEHLFEPFYRAESAGRHTTGVGIGLAVCRRVAESLGGTVEVIVDRAPNVAPGTEFRLRLPLAASDVEPALDAEAAPVAPGSAVAPA
jgi:signal transduction histidine kinase